MFFLVAAILTLFVGCTLLDGVMDMQTPFCVTELTQNVLVTDLTLNVGDTQGFMDSGYIFIEEEYIRYTSKTGTTFVIPTAGRGYTYGNTVTVASVHAVGTMVQANEANTLNSLMGYSIAEYDTEGGQSFNFVSFIWAWTKAFPKFLMWDYNFLKGLWWLLPFLYGLSIAIVVVMAKYIREFLPF